MVSQYGIKFAIHLITNHFGNLVAKVCEKLLGNGPLTLEQLIRYTELTKEQVKNSLLVLVQHNCAQAFVYEGGDGDGLRVRTQYLALFDNILHRLRFPKFLEIASRHLDDECVELLDGLLRDGRLTLKQMVDRASQGKENVVATDVVRENLCKLLTARYVERCPVPVPEKFEAPETLEQRVTEAAVPGAAIRFSLTTDTGCNADRETNSDDSQMMSVGENDAKEELTLWRANFEEFIRYLRHKVLIENVRTRMDDGAATVLSAILEATKTVEKKVKIENSDLKRIIQWARNEEVESIVLKRYGGDAYRMFRQLSKENQFCPTDKIAESTLVEKKEAPKLLYKLWKDNYLHMEKVPVMGFKQSQILMWKVNEPLIWEYVLDEMYHAALNLSLRMAFEQEKDEELLNVPKDKLKEPGPLQKKYKRLLNVWLLMGSSLMELDDALMLFHDF